MKNIETSFQMSRGFMFLVVICSTIGVCVSAYYSHDVVLQSRDKVYVMENGHSVMMALAQEHNINRPAEAKDHIKTFLKLFFELEPDEKQIKKSLAEATYLGDQSVVRLYKDYAENGYYDQLVQGNVHQKVDIDKDNIVVNFSKSPYYFRAKGRQTLVRETTITIRTLDVEGYLIDVPRTDNNPHGFVIEQFHPIDIKSDIETITRTPTN